MKIGVGIITCNRQEFLTNLLTSILPCIDVNELIIVNDGLHIDNINYSKPYSYIHNDVNVGVAKSKNKAMQHLLNTGCDYIFIIEDDMIILDTSIFSKYIEAHKISGIHHFMFAYHGPANKGGISKGKPTPRKIIDYGSVQIALNMHCVGAFCFYTRECLVAVGLNDDEFLNAYEHVEHSYRLAKQGYSTPFWWWSDIANSLKYIDEQACSEDISSIRCREDWWPNIRKALDTFKLKHNYIPVHIPDTSLTTIINFLKQIK